MDEQLSKGVIGCAISVSRALGHGFLERVYEEALAIEMKEAGISYRRQHAMGVRYKGHSVGEFCCDFLVDGRLLVELKALSALNSQHDAQLMNYLKATGITVGLLLNFGTPTLGIRRVVHGYEPEAAI